MASDDAIKAAYRRLRDGAEGDYERLIDDYWELGRMIRGRTGPGAKSGRRRLAKLLEADANRVEAARAIHSAFGPPRERDRLKAMRRADGRPPALWAVVAIARSRPASRREELLGLACSGNMSEDDLKRLLQADRGVVAGGETGGRRPRPPATLAVGLVRWAELSRGLCRYVGAVFTDEVIDRLLAAEDAAGVDVAEVAKAEELAREAGRALRRELAFLGRIRRELAAAASRASPAGDADEDRPPTSGRREGPSGPGRGGSPTAPA